MELRHVRYFLAVAEEKSFTKAAARVNVAQSPLSQQIRKLERELGVELFVRTTRSVQLTHAGQVFYDRMRAVIADGEDAIEAAQKAARGELGRISVGFTGSATYELLPALVRAYNDKFPDVTLDLHSEMGTQAQVEAILDGRLSVGLLRPPALADGLAVETVRHEPVLALLPSQHPLSVERELELAALRDEWFIAFPGSPPSTMYTLMMAGCEEAGFVPRIRHQVANATTLVALVAAGLGVALVPGSLRHLGFSGATYRPLVKPRLTVALALAYREADVNPLVRRFVETARSVILSRQQANVDRPGRAQLPDDGDEAFFSMMI